MSDSAAIKALVDAMTVGDLSQFIALFMYQGFSPEMVFAHLAKIKKDKNIDSSEFGNDMRSLVVMGVIMGSYNDHNSTKISEDGKRAGDALMEKYDLKKGGVGKDRRAVNLPRIVAAFPIFTINVVLKSPARNYGGPFSADLLPACMKTAVFPSVVPKSIDGNVVKYLLLASTCYTAEQTMAISRFSDAGAAVKNQTRYTEISFNSSMPTDSERVKFIRTLEFSYNALNTVWSKYKDITQKGVSPPSQAEFTAAGLRMI